MATKIPCTASGCLRGDVMIDEVISEKPKVIATRYVKCTVCGGTGEVEAPPTPSEIPRVN